MHHLPAKNNLIDTTPKTTKDVGSGAPLCPKPRRLRSPLPAHFLNNPALCTKHQQTNPDRRSGILNIIGEKMHIQRTEEGNELCGCSSPPGRTENPLIHDVHFLEIHGHVEIWPQLSHTN